MKVYVYDNLVTGFYVFSHRQLTVANGQHLVCLGDFDLDIQQPKKTVRKEMPVRVCANGYDFYIETGMIPKSAKNIKISYDIEE
jgi:hypothetical protein